MGGSDQGHQALPSIGARGTLRHTQCVCWVSRCTHPHPPITPHRTHGPNSLGMACRAWPPLGHQLSHLSRPAQQASPLFLSFLYGSGPPVYTWAPSNGKIHFSLTPSELKFTTASASATTTLTTSTSPPLLASLTLYPPCTVSTSPKSKHPNTPHHITSDK